MMSSGKPLFRTASEILAVKHDGDIKGVLGELDRVKQENQKQAESIIHDVLPQKIIDLNTLFQKLNTSNPAQHFTPTRYSRDAEAPCNQHIVEALEVLKLEIVGLVHIVNVLRLWISLNIPKIEDGNNFGVGVQEEILATLNSGRSSGLAVLEVISGYFLKRGKLVTLSVKHPQVEDYRRCIVELDEKQFLSIVQSCMDLRNNYSLLHDKMLKNMEKLSNPKNPSGSLYMS